MFRRRVISLLLLFVCAAAACADSLGVLLCDCAAHRSHECCMCADAPHAYGHDHACRHDAFSAGKDGKTYSPRCKCNHGHGDENLCTVSSDTDRILESLRNGVAVIVNISLNCVPEAAAQPLHALFCDAGIPPEPSPDLSSGAPRAPSVRV